MAWLNLTEADANFCFVYDFFFYFALFLNLKNFLSSFHSISNRDKKDFSKITIRRKWKVKSKKKEKEKKKKMNVL